MPDTCNTQAPLAPDAVPYDPEDLDTPVALAAQEAISMWLCTAQTAGRPNLVLVSRRIASLRAYMELVYDGLRREAYHSQQPKHCDCDRCTGKPS